MTHILYRVTMRRANGRLDVFPVFALSAFEARDKVSRDHPWHEFVAVEVEP